MLYVYTGVEHSGFLFRISTLGRRFGAARQLPNMLVMRALVTLCSRCQRPSLSIMMQQCTLPDVSCIFILQRTLALLCFAPGLRCGQAPHPALQAHPLQQRTLALPLLLACLQLASRKETLEPPSPRTARSQVLGLRSGTSLLSPARRLARMIPRDNKNIYDTKFPPGITSRVAPGFGASPGKCTAYQVSTPKHKQTT